MLFKSQHDFSPSFPKLLSYHSRAQGVLQHIFFKIVNFVGITKTQRKR